MPASSSSHARRSSVLAGVLVAALVVTSLGRVAPVAAQPAPTPPAAGATDPAADAVLYSCHKAKGQVTVSFKPDTELKDLITWVMGFTCKNFIYDSSILTRSKKITIISPVKMSPPDAYRVFLVALSTMGLTVVPKGNVMRIVESGAAKAETVPIYKHGSPGNSDDVVRAILRPNYLSTNELSNAFAGIKSPIGAVQVVNEANALIVTDYASSVRDMVSLMRELDRPVPSANIYTIKIHYADAKDMAAKLNEILGLSGGAGGGGGKGPMPTRGGGGDVNGPPQTNDVSAAVPAKILSDDRTNTLILLSNEAGYLRIKALVDRLDFSTELDAGGSLHVYRLQNADAEKLATTLNGALQGQGQQQQNRAPGAAGPARAGEGSFEGQVRVTHDAPSNSLVVVSSGRDFLTLSDVIKRLDQPRRQVYIEALVLEVQISNSRDLGTSFHAGYGIGDNNDGVILGGLQNPSLKSLDVTTLASATGLLGAIIGKPLDGSATLLGKSIPSYGAFIQALDKNSNTNILSEPHILAIDNEDSEISVGQNIPYLGGVSLGGFGLPGTTGGTSTAGISGLGANIQRENLTLDMKIKPHISGDDVVRIELEQEIKDIGDRDAQLGPTWTTRKIKTNVVVHDQQSVVIGGLMQDRIIYNESKIPLLGDIPVLGYLFKYSSKQKKKTNLLVVLTPYVIRDQFDLQQILDRKFRERAEFIASFRNLSEDKYLPRTDYRRKRGLLEEINRAVQAVEQDAVVLKELEQRGAEIPDGQIKYDVVAPPAVDDGDGGGEPAPAPAPGDGDKKPADKPAADKKPADKASAADKKPADKKPADKPVTDKPPAAAGAGAP